MSLIQVKLQQNQNPQFKFTFIVQGYLYALFLESCLAALRFRKITYGVNSFRVIFKCYMTAKSQPTESIRAFYKLVTIEPTHVFFQMFPSFPR